MKAYIAYLVVDDDADEMDAWYVAAALSRLPWIDGDNDVVVWPSTEGVDPDDIGALLIRKKLAQPVEENA